MKIKSPKEFQFKHFPLDIFIQYVISFCFFIELFLASFFFFFFGVFGRDRRTTMGMALAGVGAASSREMLSMLRMGVGGAAWISAITATSAASSAGVSTTGSALIMQRCEDPIACAHAGRGGRESERGERDEGGFETYR